MCRFLHEYRTSYDGTTAGATASADGVIFRVRVGGLLTRQETVSFGGDNLALVAPADNPKRQHCPANGRPVPESIVLGTGN